MKKAKHKAITHRRLGRTDAMVSPVGVGGSHIGKSDLSTSEAVKIMQSALDRGLNFLDNCWDYNDGVSERRMGKALQGDYRERAFLMTKLDGRTKKEACKQLDESMKRLDVDHIDLLQHHEIIRFEDVDRIFAAGGAMEAFVEARDKGKIRFIGFTGHKDPAVHLYMLETAEKHGFQFDAVQMPLNVLDVHFRSFEKLVLPKLVEKNIGVLGMKSLGSGVILKSGAVTAEECLRYSLSLPTSVVITGIDSMEILDQAISIASGFHPLKEEQMNELRKKTVETAQDGKYELFKTSTVFDSTAQHPDYLGKELEETEQLAGH